MTAKTIQGKTCAIQVNTPNKCTTITCRYYFQPSHDQYGIGRLYIIPCAVAPENGQVRAGKAGVWIAPHDTAVMTRMLDHTTAGQLVAFMEQFVGKYQEVKAEGTSSVFLVPNDGGYVLHSHFMVHRMMDCPLVSSAHSFVLPTSKVLPYVRKVEDFMDLANVFEASIGAVQFPLGLPQKDLEQLEFELKRRLTFQWHVPNVVTPKRVCVVMEPSSVIDMKDRWQAAASLGVKLVILSSGTWWADGCGVLEDMRECFISIEMKAHDAELWHKIVEVVRSYPYHIDGIFAPTDPYIVSVAQAAEALGLHTPGPKPFSTSTNKHLTRKLLDPEEKKFFFVRSLEDLDNKVATNNSITFPVICKLAVSTASEGVFKVNNISELRDAVARNLVLKQSVHGILVEPYIDGPEIDVNLVLLDGRVLYSEVVDEFPTAADLVAESAKEPFNETQALVPSHLPRSEQEAVIADMVSVVKLQGFTTGVFHCEARVCNSTVEYSWEPDAKFPSLQPKKGSQGGKPPQTYAHLLEVNARPPGLMCSASSLIARGIDYWALQLLCSLRDWPRYTALATPYLDDVSCNNVILACVSCEISPKLVRRIFPHTPIQQLNKRMIQGAYNPIPELSRKYAVAKRVLRHRTRILHGEGFGGNTDEWIWINAVVICSPEGRRHALETVEAFEVLYKNAIKEMDW